MAPRHRVPDPRLRERDGARPSVVGRLPGRAADRHPDATTNTRIAQQIGASCGTAVVAVALQSLLTHGAGGAFHGAFWWATGITVTALVPALALPAARTAAQA